MFLKRLLSLLIAVSFLSAEIPITNQSEQTQNIAPMSNFSFTSSPWDSTDRTEFYLKGLVKIGAIAFVCFLPNSAFGASQGMSIATSDFQLSWLEAGIIGFIVFMGIAYFKRSTIKERLERFRKNLIDFNESVEERTDGFVPDQTDFYTLLRRAGYVALKKATTRIARRPKKEEHPVAEDPEPTLTGIERPAGLFIRKSHREAPSVKTPAKRYEQAPQILISVQIAI